MLKAEVLPGRFGAPDKDNERFVVTSMRGPSPRTLYQQDYCARGQAEGWIQQSEVRSESRPDFGSVLHRQLWSSAVCGGGICIAPAIAPTGSARHRAGYRSAQDSHPVAVQDRRARQTVQRPGRAQPHLPTACPVKALLATVCQRLYPPNSRVRACWLPHDPARLAHETMPPTLFYNYFTLHPASGLGEYRLKIKKIASRPRQMLCGKFMQNSGYAKQF